MVAILSRPHCVNRRFYWDPGIFYLPPERPYSPIIHKQSTGVTWTLPAIIQIKTYGVRTVEKGPVR